MQSFVKHNALLAFGLVLLLFATGCSPYAVNDILRENRRDGRRYEIDRYRIDRDVRRFVSQVDRSVRLDRRQARDIERVVRDRTYRLMDRVRPADRRYAYPFPRRDYRDMNGAQREFWYDVDRRIDRHLSFRQASRYAQLTGRRARVRRYSDRYEPRRRTDDRRYGGDYDVRRDDRRDYDRRGTDDRDDDDRDDDRRTRERGDVDRRTDGRTSDAPRTRSRGGDGDRAVGTRGRSESRAGTDTRSGVEVRSRSDARRDDRGDASASEADRGSRGSTSGAGENLRRGNEE